MHGYNADPGVRGSLREDLRADGCADAELHSWGYDTPVGCLGHNDLLGDDATSAGVRAFLRS
ncbi:hypothetical protein [Streptomyces sp. NPDC055005]